MSRLRKQYELAEFKAIPDAQGKDTGDFSAVVSVFDNVDLQGDRVLKGAFKKSLQKWRKGDAPIPILWSHSWGDPFAFIGEADPKQAEEIEMGLKLVGKIDIDKPFAAQVFDLLKSKRVREWSFAYDVLDEAKGEDRANNLIELDIIEAGPTLKGANPDTVTLGVKAVLESVAAKAGRTISAKNEAALRSAYEAIGTVLSSLERTEEPEKGVVGERGTEIYVPEKVADVIPIKSEEPDEDAEIRLRIRALTAGLV